MAIAYVNAGTGTGAASGTTMTQTVPASLVNGNLLIAIGCISNGDTITVSGTGWSKFGQVSVGSTFTACLAYTIVSGTPPSCVFSWTNTVANRSIAWQWSGTAAAPFGASASNTGSTSTHSNSGITTTADASVVIYIDGAKANTALATPAGWTENSDVGSATAGMRTTAGLKAVNQGGSASGAISVTGAAADWVMWQIELLIPKPPLKYQLNQAVKRSNL